MPKVRAYLSFVSALHLHGMTEQIPQTITLASSSHSHKYRTSLGTYEVHRIAPEFFLDFDWYKGNGSFLVASPEKALLDCLYLAARKKKQFAGFPELTFPKSFSFKRAASLALKIRDVRLRRAVLKRLEAVRTLSR